MSDFPTLERILEMWGEPGGAREAVRMFQTRVPPGSQPGFAVELMSAVQPLFKRFPEVEVLYALAADARRWAEGGSAFETLRRVTLAAEESGDLSGYDFLLLAEDVAKTIANASCDASDAAFKPGRALQVAERALAISHKCPNKQIERDVARALAASRILTER